MAKQNDVMDEAVRAIANGKNGLFPCGANSTVCTVRSGKVKHVMLYSYYSPIARITLDCDSCKPCGDVEFNARYYNCSVTTSRHLTMFLNALFHAGLIGCEVFEIRANRKELAKLHDAAIEGVAKSLWEHTFFAVA